MTKEELWKIYCKANPNFECKDSTVTMTCRGLRKLFDQTFDQGFRLGKEAGKNEKSIFEQFFGKS